MITRPDMETTGTDGEESHDYVGEMLATLVPQWVARRAIDVAVTTDKQTYRVDESVEISITFRNPFPIPVPVQTETPRLWGWTVDGLLEASDEQPSLSETPNRLNFRPFEKKEFTRNWSGRFKRTGRCTRWEPATPGTYEIGGFLGVKGSLAKDTTTIRIQ